MNPSDIVSTSIVRARVTGGTSYVVVTLTPAVKSAEYKIYPTGLDAGVLVDGYAHGNVYQSGDGTTPLTFTFPIDKKTLYFVSVNCKVDNGSWNNDASLTWLMDPFKRRPVSREDIAPTAPAPAVVDAAPVV